MTLNEFIADIQEMFNAYTDDSMLSDEHLAFVFTNKRNAYLKNYISNIKISLPLEAMQLICLKLEEDDACEDDLKFLKSTVKIPATLESTGRSNISQVFLNSRMAKWINIIDYSRIPYLSGGRYNEKQIYIAVDPNNYLIVYSPSGNHEYLEEIKLNIIAENPEEAYELQCDKDEQCDFFDAKYPIESSMAAIIATEMKNEFIMKYRMPVDSINNGSDESIGNATQDDRRRKRSE